MSDLTDRYLMAVCANLPKKDRADITAELRDILFSHVEAKEEALGHELTRDEEEALLRDFGHPLEVAGRYGKNQQLIGPSVYPFYIFFLKVVMGIIAAIYIGLYALSSITRAGAPHAQGDIVEALFVVFAAVTLTFAAIERTGSIGKIAKAWKPNQLPLMGAPQGRSPFEVLFEIAITVAVTLWWVGVVRLPTPAPRHSALALGPIFTTLFWPILALFIAQIGIDIFELAMPGLAKAHAWTRIVFHLAMVVVVAMLWRAGPWIIVSDAFANPGVAERVQANFDKGFQVGLGFAILAAVYEIWRAGRRLMRLDQLREVRGGQTGLLSL